MYCSLADEEKEAMRKQMREELLAQMEWNNQNMMNMTSWDDQVRYTLSVTVGSPPSIPLVGLGTGLSKGSASTSLSCGRMLQENYCTEGCRSL